MEVDSLSSGDETLSDKRHPMVSTGNFRMLNTESLGGNLLITVGGVLSESSPVALAASCTHTKKLIGC